MKELTLVEHDRLLREATARLWPQVSFMYVGGPGASMPTRTALTWLDGPCVETVRAQLVELGIAGLGAWREVGPVGRAAALLRAAADQRVPAKAVLFDSDRQRRSLAWWSDMDMTPTALGPLWERATVLARLAQEIDGPYESAYDALRSHIRKHGTTLLDAVTAPAGH
jgi:hypothetical protein